MWQTFVRDNESILLYNVSELCPASLYLGSVGYSRICTYTGYSTFKKMKGVKNQVIKAKTKGKAKLEEIQKKDWAEPTGSALKAAASVVSLIPPPVGNVLKGALSMGGAVLNPDPTLGDLRRAKEEIIEEVKVAFLEVAKDMGDITPELLDLRSDIQDLLKLVSDKEFYEGEARRGFWKKP